MKYLLDTQVILWFFHQDKRLGHKTRQLIIENAENTNASYVSAWEVAIKTSLGKLRTKQPFKEYIHQASLIWLPIKLGHFEHIVQLPHIHGDPFDRMLIAQAISENLTLVTGDKNILKYPVVSLIDATT